MPTSSQGSAAITRRELIVGAGAGAAALLLEGTPADAQPDGRPVVFRDTTIVNADLVQNNVALAVVGTTIAAIGPTDEILKRYPNSEVIDGRGKAIFPGLVNCH